MCRLDDSIAVRARLPRRRRLPSSCLALVSLVRSLRLPLWKCELVRCCNRLIAANGWVEAVWLWTSTSVEELARPLIVPIMKLLPPVKVPTIRRLKKPVIRI